MKLPISPRLAFLCRATGHRLFYSRQYRRDLNRGGMKPPAALTFEAVGDDRLRLTRDYCCGSQEWVPATLERWKQEHGIV